MTLSNGHASTTWNDSGGSVSFGGRYRGLGNRDLSTNGLVFEVNTYIAHCASQAANYAITYASPEGCAAQLVCEWNFSVSCWDTSLNNCGGPSVSANHPVLYMVEETFGFNTTNQLHRIISNDGSPSLVGIAQQAYNYTPISQSTSGNCSLPPAYDRISDLLGGGTPLTLTYNLPPNASSIQLAHYLTSLGNTPMDNGFGCGSGPCETSCIGDLNGDCAVDISDLLMFLLLYEAGTIDLNGDGATTTDDLTIMLASFDTGC